VPTKQPDGALSPEHRRGETPTMEQLGELRGGFDETKTKMASLLTDHFAEAIQEKNRLLEDLTAQQATHAELKTRFDFVQSSLAYAHEQIMQERENVDDANQSLDELTDQHGALTAAHDTLTHEHESEKKRTEQQLRVATEKLTAERLEKEQYKVLVDKIGAEIVKEKEDDRHLVEEFERAKAGWEEQVRPTPR
jgi:chromosome segregation ATPase